MYILHGYQYITAYITHLKGSLKYIAKGPVTQAQTPGLRKDREQIPTFARVLRDCWYLTVQTLLRVQIDMFLTRINVFLTQLTPFLRDPYVICAQIARHV